MAVLSLLSGELTGFAFGLEAADHVMVLWADRSAPSAGDMQWRPRPRLKSRGTR
jgi:hypothetical protein